MAELVIRDVDEGVLQRLQHEAKTCGKPVEDVVRAILTEYDAQLRRKSWERAVARADRIGWRGGPTGAELIREDRDTNYGRDLDD